MKRLSSCENQNATCECTVRGPNLASRTKSFAIPVTSVYLKEHKTRHQQRPAPVLRPLPYSNGASTAFLRPGAGKSSLNSYSVAHLLSKLEERTGGEAVFELVLMDSCDFGSCLRGLADTGFVSVQNFVKLGLYLKK